MNWKILGLASITALLLACATTPVALPLAKVIPADRVLAFREGSTATTGHLVIVRDEGFIGSGCFVGLFVNGVLAARIDVAERVELFVPPGEVLLKVGRDPQGRGLCATGQDQWTQRESFIKAGETKVFRTGLDANGKPDIFRADL